MIVLLMIGALLRLRIDAKRDVISQAETMRVTAGTLVDVE
jgi:hypothetical protein